MSFNSYIFIFLFLPLTICGWYALNHIKKYRMALAFLALMSMWFYGYFNPYYLLIMIGSILCNFALSLVLEKAQAKNSKLISTCVLIAGVAINLGILFYFKYYDFFIENVNALFKVDFTLRHIVLPLGISFFTFQQLSFIIDRTQGKAKHYDLIEYATFVSFFPQLVAGPIVLHSEMMQQFEDIEKRAFNAENFYRGVISFTLGLGKKVLLADTLAILANYGFDNTLYLDSFSSLLVLAAYTLELYFDFSGYSDMAIGLGLMFGISLPQNFNSPYKAASLKELWSRWHMTLTRFMSLYVYYPLGGNRKGKARTLLNIFIVFVLSGLWHGAAWTYVCWGILTGLIVIWDNLYIVGFDKNAKHPAKVVLPRWIGNILTVMCFSALLIVFRSESLTAAGRMFADLTKGWTGNIFKTCAVFDIPEIYVLEQAVSVIAPMCSEYVRLAAALIYVLIGAFICTRKNTAEIIASKADKKSVLVFTVIILVYSIVSFSQVSTFIYFNF